MAECPLYSEQHIYLRSREIGGDATPQRHLVPCCDHKHSPLPRHLAGRVIGNKLQCGGAYARCQVPEHLRIDAV